MKQDAKLLHEVKKMNNGPGAPEKIRQLKKVCNGKDRKCISGKLSNL